jgi:DNA-binding NtrC family response regulator
VGYRLAGAIGGRCVAFPLRAGRLVVGSAPDADVTVGHPTVSRRHAGLEVDGDGVAVTDLRSSNGTFVDGRRVEAARLGDGQTVAFGAVSLRLERVADEDLQAAVTFAPTASADPGPAPTTVGESALHAFTLDALPRLLRRLADGEDVVALAQAAGAAVFDGLPVLSVSVRHAGGVLFEARREGVDPAAGEAASCGDERGRVEARLAHANAVRALEPLLAAAADLVRAAARPAVRRPPVPSAEPPRPPDPPSVVPEVHRLFAEAARVARGDVGVLVCGESGTGKELLARFLHAASPRARGPFVALNCAALPRDLLETELFGIERGVATGVDARPGKFELAHDGTLFLDEIGDMALETQARILRVLQEGEVFRIGGSAPRPAAVRTVSATHRDLARLRAEGRFREDLYYRIATWTAEVPPLRRRRADIPNLAAHFLMREAEARGVRVGGISRAAVDALVAYDWPGNVRQLEKEMSRAVLFLEDGELLDRARLAPELRRPAAGGPAGSLPERLRAVERDAVEAALSAAGGDVERAAAALGMGRSTLYRRLKHLGLAVP